MENQNKVNPVLDNYQYAKILDEFRDKIIAPLEKQITEANGILSDPERQWDTEEQRQAAFGRKSQLENRFQYLDGFYRRTMEFVKSYEALTDLLALWYKTWYENISYRGRQEQEMMSSQADQLHGIFEQLYFLLEPLKLDLPAPQALNLSTKE